MMDQDDTIISEFVLVSVYMQQMWSCDCFDTYKQKKNNDPKKQSK